MSGHVYRVHIHQQHDEGGVSAWLDHGDAFLLEGRRYARRPGGSLSPAGDDWHETAEAAYQAAAPQLVDIAARINAQAARWMEGRS